MQSVIDDIWYGNTSYCEQCGADDAEIEIIASLMSEHEDALKQELSKEHNTLFTQYVSWADKYACYMSAAAFREGFSLACKLLSEALLKNKDNFRSSM